MKVPDCLIEDLFHLFGVFEWSESMFNDNMQSSLSQMIQHHVVNSTSVISRSCGFMGNDILSILPSLCTLHRIISVLTNRRVLTRLSERYDANWRQMNVARAALTCSCKHGYK